MRNTYTLAFRMASWNLIGAIRNGFVQRDDTSVANECMRLAGEYIPLQEYDSLCRMASDAGLALPSETPRNALALELADKLMTDLFAYYRTEFPMGSDS